MYNGQESPAAEGEGDPDIVGFVVRAFPNWEVKIVARAQMKFCDGAD